MIQYDSDWYKFISEQYKGDSSAMQSAYSVLRRADDLASEFGVDVTMLDTERLQRVIDAISGAKKQSADAIMNVLKRYDSWRKRNGLNTSGNISGVNADLCKSILDGMVASPNHLNKVLDCVFDGVKSQSIDAVYRAFLWLCFCGIRDTEAILVTTKDIDFKKNKISFGGCEFRMYEQAVSDIAFAAFAEELVESRTREGAPVKRVCRRDEGDLILRGKATTKLSDPNTILVKTMRPTLTRKFKEALVSGRIDPGLPTKTSPDKIYRSGVFYRFHSDLSAGIEPDFKAQAMHEFRSNVMQGKKYTKSQYSYDAKTIARLAREIEADYKLWARAFEL